LVVPVQLLFLIGCGSVAKNGFEVRQYLLPDYTDETAILEHLLNELTADKTVVTYNGSAFDLPLIRDRMIINRVARDILCQNRIDLLHSARRLFKRRLGDCTLQNIERELFGFFRTDDIPGYLIPSVYFDWLSNEDPTPLQSVLEHNRYDILTMYFLLKKVAGIFESEGNSLCHIDDIYSLSRIYNRHRRNNKVVNMYYQMESSEAGSQNSEQLLFHSIAFKREGNFEKALAIWKKLADKNNREAFQANIELAKYYEHRSKKPVEAIRYTEAAQRLTGIPPGWRKGLSRRLQRLRLKLIE